MCAFLILFLSSPQANNSVPDPLCNILGLNSYMGKTSTSCPPDVPQVKSEPPVNDQQLVAYMKDRQKKDNHNMSEFELRVWEIDPDFFANSELYENYQRMQ